MWKQIKKWLRACGGWLATPLGERGEAYAVRYLQRQGLTIVARRARNLLGEIDIVAVDPTDPARREIVFVEVRTKTSSDAGHPLETVDFDKQRRLTRLALAYLKRHRLLGRPTRFDVIGIVWPDPGSEPRVEHIRHAFTAVGCDGLYS